jgi:hypothetical protein
MPTLRVCCLTLCPWSPGRSQPRPRHLPPTVQASPCRTQLQLNPTPLPLENRQQRDAPLQELQQVTATITLCIRKPPVARRYLRFADTQRLPAEVRPRLEGAALIDHTSRSVAAAWPLHPQRSCYWRSLPGQSRRSDSGPRRQQGSCFSSKFSPVVMSSARLRTAGCCHQRLEDQTSMGFIHGFVAASAHDPHLHRMNRH